MVAMVEQQQENYRKRRRLTWDDAPAPLQQPEAACGESRKQVLCRHVSPPKREDDREGHYVFNLGDNLTPRYKILSKMGEGTFGRVLECWDRHTREYVAIKVVRSIHKYREAAMIEIDVLEQLAKNDKGGSHCVQIRNWFDYRNHICIVIYNCTIRTLDGVIVESTRSDFGGKGIPTRHVLGESKMILGLLEGVTTMKKFKMKPELHYGEDDCPVLVSDNFPKEAELHFEIEMIDFSKVKIIDSVHNLYICICMCVYDGATVVARKAGEPLSIEKVIVAPPLSGEVRVRIIAALCVTVTSTSGE